MQNNQKMIHPETPLGKYIETALKNPSFFQPTGTGSPVTGNLIEDRLKAIRKFVENEGKSE